MSRTDVLKKEYKLEQHPEGGWFAEVYTAPYECNNRPLAGSIYFLLDNGDLSHFHQIDCDEIWYYHEGCGMVITMLMDGRMEKLTLGNDIEHGEHAMVLIPKGAIFGAENLEKDGYTFVSCATTPNFTYEGFRLVNKQEIYETYPKVAEEVAYLAYETI
ncbi:MAG: cupin domain-containing protein [Lachnospiraceae bacterium]|nr:cupin domain-containing protein [Lachnospiraceae bacterium]